MNPSSAREIAEILSDVLTTVRTTPQDLAWQSTFADEPHLIATLTDHLTRLHRTDTSRLPELRLLFAVTGPLCEIAVSSGWSDRYHALATRFDTALER